MKKFPPIALSSIIAVMGIICILSYFYEHNKLESLNNLKYITGKIEDASYKKVRRKSEVRKFRKFFILKLEDINYEFHATVGFLDYINHLEVLELINKYPPETVEIGYIETSTLGKKEMIDLKYLNYSMVDLEALKTQKRNQTYMFLTAGILLIAAAIFYLARHLSRRNKSDKWQLG